MLRRCICAMARGISRSVVSSGFRAEPFLPIEISNLCRGKFKERPFRSVEGGNKLAGACRPHRHCLDCVARTLTPTDVSINLRRYIVCPGRRALLYPLMFAL